MSEHIILVDKNDQEIWWWEKLDVHEKWLLHRAFSLFVFNSKGELMLQQRDKWKYHSWWLWTNTCCSHPRIWEEIDEAIHRRLQEEMWFDCELVQKHTLIYKVKLDKWLTEHEYLHIFVWKYDDNPKLNSEEASDWKWIKMPDLMKDINDYPEKYTEWFKIIFNKWLFWENNSWLFTELLKAIDNTTSYDPWVKQSNLEWYVDELIDESREVKEAILNKDDINLAEELWDVLWDLLVLTKIAEKENKFSLQTVIDWIVSKMKGRKPHVFSWKIVSLEDAKKVWRSAKEREKGWQ